MSFPKPNGSKSHSYLNDSVHFPDIPIQISMPMTACRKLVRNQKKCSSIIIPNLAHPNIAVGHVECTYSSATGQWSEPRFVEGQLLTVHGLAPGLNYGIFPSLQPV